MSAIRQQMTSLPYNRPYVWMIGAWVLSMISLPIAKWVWGVEVIPVVVFAGVLFQFAAVMAILAQRWRTPRLLGTFFTIALFTWLAEAIGSASGVPFGAYFYTDLLQPRLLGVPLAIPLAWMMMLAPSWAIAYAILGGDLSGRRRAVFVLLSAGAMTAWDLYLDPQMVGWGFWVWENPVGYFGIPWSNYAGWLIVSAMATALVHPEKLPYQPLMVVYGIVWVLQAIGLAVFWAQPGPAFFGFIGMGAFVALALRGMRSMKPAQAG